MSSARNVGRQGARLAMVATVAALGLAGCGDDGEEQGTRAVAPDRETILIKTHLTIPTGKILPGSVIGRSPFCRGGTFRDEQASKEVGEAAIKTFRCPEGRLKLGFSPQGEDGETQTGPWKVVGGTGRFEGLRGHGQMTVRFKRDSGTEGAETFTGTVTR